MGSVSARPAVWQMVKTTWLMRRSLPTLVNNSSLHGMMCAYRSTPHGISELPLIRHQHSSFLKTAHLPIRMSSLAWRSYLFLVRAWIFVSGDGGNWIYIISVYTRTDGWFLRRMYLPLINYSQREGGRMFPRLSVILLYNMETSVTNAHHLCTCCADFGAGRCSFSVRDSKACA